MFHASLQTYPWFRKSQPLTKPSAECEPVPGLPPKQAASCSSLFVELIPDTSWMCAVCEHLPSQTAAARASFSPGRQGKFSHQLVPDSTQPPVQHPDRDAPPPSRMNRSSWVIHPEPRGSRKFVHLLVPKGTHKIPPSVNTKGFHKWRQGWAAQGQGLTQLFPGLVNPPPLGHLLYP